MIKKSSTQFLSSTVLSGYNFSAKCQCFEKVFLIILLIRLARIHFVKKHWQTCWFEYFSVCFVWKLWTYKLMTLGMFTNAEPSYWSANITNVINQQCKFNQNKLKNISNQQQIWKNSQKCLVLQEMHIVNPNFCHLKKIEKFSNFWVKK